MALPTYTIEILRRDGCPAGVVLDMARFDAATITEVKLTDGTAITPLADAPPFTGNVREVTMRPQHRNYLRPTMARWASFAVGAKLKEG